MHKKKLLMVMILMVLILSGILFLSFEPAISKGKTAAVRGEIVSWQLSNARVVNPGKILAIKEGALIKDYAIVAAVRSIGSDDSAELIFEITLSAFSPSSDMAGHKAGIWYVLGQWTIAESNAGEKAKKISRSLQVIKGNLSAVLHFNPVTGNGSVNAHVKIPTSPIGSRWIFTDGIFSGNEKSEGIIHMNGGIRPAVYGGIQ